MYCPYCGTQNKPSEKFCIKCGFELIYEAPSALPSYPPYRPYPSPLPSPPPSPIVVQPKKKRKFVFSIISGLVVTLLLLYILFAFFIPLLLSPQYREYPEKANIDIQHLIKISTNKEIEYKLDLPVPQNISPSVQKVVSISIYPACLKISKYNKDWFLWSGKTSGKTEIKINYKLETQTVWWDFKELISGSVADIPSNLKEKYTSDEWFLTDDDGKPIDRDKDGKQDVMIEPSAPAIKGLAMQLTSADTTVHEMLTSIYKYMRKNIKYVAGRSGEDPQHALATLSSKKGDCDEQSYLFISLARALHIPAWIELGAMYNQMTQNWGGHAWVGAYIPSGTDNRSGWNVNIDVVNDEFLVRPPNKFAEWTDDGDGEHLKDYYRMFGCNWTGRAPVVRVDSSYEVDYQATGYVQVAVVGGSNLAPGFEIFTIILATVISFKMIRMSKIKTRTQSHLQQRRSGPLGW